MFTWNFQYVSKVRLAEAFGQLMLGNQPGDILIRIHTAIHMRDEATELARFIKSLVPGAHILGTSTNAVIMNGKLMPDQCAISVTQMSKGKIKAALLPAVAGEELSPEKLCARLDGTVVNDGTQFLLAFIAGSCTDAGGFADRCTEKYPGVRIMGGAVSAPGSVLSLSETLGFVFDEKGWSDYGIIAASIGGKGTECICSCASGAISAGSGYRITGVSGKCLLSLNGKDAAQEYLSGVGVARRKEASVTDLFPFVYSGAEDMPLLVSFSEKDERILCADRTVSQGGILHRAFICKKQIVRDNRTLFDSIQGFAKAETLFGYSCAVRSRRFPGCVGWELSVYENSNMCGCLTDGEFACVNGRNVYANCLFTVAALGEEAAEQQYNPYAFSNTGSLSADDRRLLEYLTETERSGEYTGTDGKAFIRECEHELFYSERSDIPNRAAMDMDMTVRGYDRICMINVLDTANMKAAFTEEMIERTYEEYISECVNFSQEHGYTVYLLNKWHIAVGSQSEFVPLLEFVADMRVLQERLLKASYEHIAIVPVFCTIDGCTADNADNAYSEGRIDMMRKDLQFYVREVRFYQLDAESIRERSRMVNIINYAIAADKVIPYYQGIYDNKRGFIHHYESLVRIEDENGKLYYPGSFLDVARTYGLLYDSISRIMIKKVFERFIDSEDNSVSINLGIRDINNGAIVEYIYDMLSSARHPENFVFEILENEDIEDYDSIIKFVDMIHELGARISIDDFGSGYSNLQHIANIHCDYLKIDGSIVRNCCIDEQCANLIALISGWKNLSASKFRIIAEFVENTDIQELLLDYDIDFSQGYLFSKPSPTVDV